MTKEALKLALEALESMAETLLELGEQTTFNEDQAMTNAKEALAQPEQEPVASYLPEMSIPNFSTRVAWGAPDHIDLRNGWRPLYTTPPQRPWVGLTDEQREACTQSPFTEDNYQDIEDKLKELNT